MAPPLLDGKRLLVTGVVTQRSIAFAVASLAQQFGAEVVLSSYGRALRMTERAARGLPHPVDVLELDVAREEHFEALHDSLERRWGGVDGVVHAIAFAPPDALGGTFMDVPARSATTAFEVSAYSLAALGRAVRPLMEGSPGGGSIVGLDFDASLAWPGYDWMGVAKGALETIARYMAMYMGPAGVRVNLVSAGPLRTAAAGGVPAFDAMSDSWRRCAPLGWSDERTEAVAGPVCFLLSDLAAGITGEIVHVDGGFHIVGAAANGRPEARVAAAGSGA
ncbi:MAG: enoyl-ACP reductase FabI [Actinomycetota bacterium]|nr:enoyl-ACP reductase FabI [Actinomycetota bacterium]